MIAKERLKLKKLLKRLFPSAKLTNHPMGVVLAKKNATVTLVVGSGANLKPFHLVATRAKYEAMWDAAAKLNAELCYAIPDDIGLHLRLLPLTALDLQKPNWKTYEESTIYDEESGEYVHAEVVRIPLGIANTASVPVHRWTEYEIQASSVEWLRAHRPELIIFSVPVEAAIRQWGKFAKTGLTAGISDTVVMLPGGRTIYCEFKRPKGEMRESQLEFQKHCKRLGQEYAVVRSLTEFQSLVA